MEHPPSPEQEGIILDHRFCARAKELSLTRTATKNALKKWGWKSDTVEDIVLAIDEACQNIVRHAYQGESDQEIILKISRTQRSIEITLQDFASAVNPNCMQPRDLDEIRPGGLGCHFIQQVMDEVSLTPSQSGVGNTLTMRKYHHQDL